MTAVYFLLGLITFMQTLVLVGICRTNFKLIEIESRVSTLNDLIVPGIGANMEIITDVRNQLTDIVKSKKKYKKKKKEEYTFYADNESES